MLATCRSYYRSIAIDKLNIWSNKLRTTLLATTYTYCCHWKVNPLVGGRGSNCGARPCPISRISLLLSFQHDVRLSHFCWASCNRVAFICRLGKKRSYTRWNKQNTVKVVRHFWSFISAGKLPVQADIMPFLDAHPEMDIHWTKVRTKVFNETQAYTKNNRKYMCRWYWYRT